MQVSEEMGGGVDGELFLMNVPRNLIYWMKLNRIFLRSVVTFARYLPGRLSAIG